MQSGSHDPGKLGDIIINLKDAESYELGTGTQIKLLRYSEETGDWVLWVSTVSYTHLTLPTIYSV